MNYLVCNISNFDQELKGGGIQDQVGEITSCEESFYFPLPKEPLNSMKGSINIKNKDNEYFRWCLIRYLNPVNKRANIRNVEDKFAKQLNFKGMQFPVHKKRLRKNKKNNTIFPCFWF